MEFAWLGMPPNSIIQPKSLTKDKVGSELSRHLPLDRFSHSGNLSLDHLRRMGGQPRLYQRLLLASPIGPQKDKVTLSFAGLI